MLPLMMISINKSDRFRDWWSAFLTTWMMMAVGLAASAAPTVAQSSSAGPPAMSTVAAATSRVPLEYESTSGSMLSNTSTPSSGKYLTSASSPSVAMPTKLSTNRLAPSMMPSLPSSSLHAAWSSKLSSAFISASNSLDTLTHLTSQPMRTVVSSEVTMFDVTTLHELFTIESESQHNFKHTLHETTSDQLLNSHFCSSSVELTLHLNTASASSVLPSSPLQSYPIPASVIFPLSSYQPITELVSFTSIQSTVSYSSNSHLSATSAMPFSSSFLPENSYTTIISHTINLSTNTHSIFSTPTIASVYSASNDMSYHISQQTTTTSPSLSLTPFNSVLSSLNPSITFPANTRLTSSFDPILSSVLYSSNLTPPSFSSNLFTTNTPINTPTPDSVSTSVTSNNLLLKPSIFSLPNSYHVRYSLNLNSFHSNAVLNSAQRVASSNPHLILPTRQTSLHTVGSQVVNSEDAVSLTPDPAFPLMHLSVSLQTPAISISVSDHTLAPLQTTSPLGQKESHSTLFESLSIDSVTSKILVSTPRSISSRSHTTPYSILAANSSTKVLSARSFNIWPTSGYSTEHKTPSLSASMFSIYPSSNSLDYPLMTSASQTLLYLGVNGNTPPISPLVHASLDVISTVLVQTTEQAWMTMHDITPFPSRSENTPSQIPASSENPFMHASNSIASTPLVQPSSLQSSSALLHEALSVDVHASPTPRPSFKYASSLMLETSAFPLFFAPFGLSTNAYLASGTVSEVETITSIVSLPFSVDPLTSMLGSALPASLLSSENEGSDVFKVHESNSLTSSSTTKRTMPLTTSLTSSFPSGSIFIGLGSSSSSAGFVTDQPTSLPPSTSLTTEGVGISQDAVTSTSLESILPSPSLTNSPATNPIPQDTVTPAVDSLIFSDVLTSVITQTSTLVISDTESYLVPQETRTLVVTPTMQGSVSAFVTPSIKTSKGESFSSSLPLESASSTHVIRMSSIPEKLFSHLSRSTQVPSTPEAFTHQYMSSPIVFLPPPTSSLTLPEHSLSRGTHNTSIMHSLSSASLAQSKFLSTSNPSFAPVPSNSPPTHSFNLFPTPEIFTETLFVTETLQLTEEVSLSVMPTELYMTMINEIHTRSQLPTFQSNLLSSILIPMPTSTLLSTSSLLSSYPSLSSLASKTVIGPSMLSMNTISETPPLGRTSIQIAPSALGPSSPSLRNAILSLTSMPRVSSTISELELTSMASDVTADVLSVVSSYIDVTMVITSFETVDVLSSTDLGTSSDGLMTTSTGALLEPSELVTAVLQPTTISTPILSSANHQNMSRNTQTLNSSFTTEATPISATPSLSSFVQSIKSSSHLPGNVTIALSTVASHLVQESISSIFNNTFYPTESLSHDASVLSSIPVRSMNLSTPSMSSSFNFTKESSGINLHFQSTTFYNQSEQTIVPSFTGSHQFPTIMSPSVFSTPSLSAGQTVAPSIMESSKFNSTMSVGDIVTATETLPASLMPNISADTSSVTGAMLTVEQTPSAILSPTPVSTVAQSILETGFLMLTPSLPTLQSSVSATPIMSSSPMLSSVVYSLNSVTLIGPLVSPTPSDMVPNATSSVTYTVGTTVGPVMSESLSILPMPMASTVAPTTLLNPVATALVTEEPTTMPLSELMVTHLATSLMPDESGTTFLLDTSAPTSFTTDAITTQIATTADPATTSAAMGVSTSPTGPTTTVVSTIKTTSDVTPSTDAPTTPDGVSSSPSRMSSAPATTASTTTTAPSTSRGSTPFDTSFATIPYWLVMGLSILESDDTRSATFIEEMETNLAIMYTEARRRSNQRALEVEELLEDLDPGSNPGVDPSQAGRRRRRAVAVDTITAQIIDMTRDSSNPTNVELIFYVVVEGIKIPAGESRTVLEELTLQEMTLYLKHPVYSTPTEFEPLTTPMPTSGPPSRLWIIGAVLAPLFFLAFLCCCCCCCCNRRPPKEDGPMDPDTFKMLQFKSKYPYRQYPATPQDQQLQPVPRGFDVVKQDYANSAFGMENGTPERALQANDGEEDEAEVMIQRETTSRTAEGHVSPLLRSSRLQFSHSPTPSRSSVSSLVPPLPVKSKFQPSTRSRDLSSSSSDAGEELYKQRREYMAAQEEISRVLEPELFSSLGRKSLKSKSSGKKSSLQRMKDRKSDGEKFSKAKLKKMESFPDNHYARSGITPQEDHSEPRPHPEPLQETRQKMHALIDEAFSLVGKTSPSRNAVVPISADLSHSQNSTSREGKKSHREQTHTDPSRVLFTPANAPIPKKKPKDVLKDGETQTAADLGQTSRVVVIPVNKPTLEGSGIVWSPYSAADELARLTQSQEPASLPGGLNPSPNISPRGAPTNHLAGRHGLREHKPDGDSLRGNKQGGVVERYADMLQEMFSTQSPPQQPSDDDDDVVPANHAQHNRGVTLLEGEPDYDWSFDPSINGSHGRGSKKRHPSSETPKSNRTEIANTSGISKDKDATLRNKEKSVGKTVDKFYDELDVSSNLKYPTGQFSPQVTNAVREELIRLTRRMGDGEESGMV